MAARRNCLLYVQQVVVSRPGGTVPVLRPTSLRLYAGARGRMDM